MRRATLAAVSLVTSLATFVFAAAGPAVSDPASVAVASAHGLQAVGALPISPTITTAAAQPPGQDTVAEGGIGAPTLLTVPLGNIALAGVVGVNANAHQADDINPTLTAPPIVPSDFEDPIEIGPVNARGFAKTSGLGLLLSSDDIALDAILDLLQAEGGLLTADAVSAEAVAVCVNNQPVFDTGFQVAGLGGAVGGALDELVQQVLALASDLGLIGEGAVLADIISIVPGRVTPLPDGIAVDGLTIDLLNGLETVVISHAEARMPPGCGVAPPAPPSTIAAPNGGGTLAATGTELPLLPVGLGMVGAAAVCYTVVRRSRRATAQ